METQMFRPLLLACVVSTFVTSALAQSQKLPPELAGLPDEVKGLKWQAIDWATVQPLERCRALQLLNHTLEELSANAAAEADLMSAYVEKNNLGEVCQHPAAAVAQIAQFPPRGDGRCCDAPRADERVVLRHGAGRPRSQSAEVVRQMYERTCARRWGEFDESRHQVRCMSSFLGNSDKLQDYDAWATAEAIRRQAEARQRAAASAQAKAQDAAATRQNMEAQLRQQQVELTQMKAALSVADAQLQQAAAAGQPAAQSAAASGGGRCRIPDPRFGLRVRLRPLRGLRRVRIRLRRVRRQARRRYRRRRGR